MQSSLFIITLVLQPERLIRIPIDPFVLSSDPRRYSCRTTADCRGYPSLWDTDVVVVEIGEVLFAVFGIVKDLRQRFVAVLVGVEMGVAALVGILLRQSRTVPDEMGPLWFGAGPGQFVFAFFGESSPERVVGVFPDFGVAGFLFNLGADQLVFGVVLEVLVFAVGQLAKEPIFQTASKNGLRPSEKRKLRACFPHTP